MPRGDRVTVNRPTVLVMETCCTCGILFGMDDQFQNYRLDDGKSFYCPAGHPQMYTGNWKVKAEKAEIEAYQAKVALQEAEAKNRQLTDDILDKTQEVQRLQKRVSNGVCPHCHRTFQQLARHMKSKHNA
jgi:hypothetical protein